MSKPSSHDIANDAVNIVRSNVDRQRHRFREFPTSDYGIDAMIELFENGEVTGRFVLVQIKGSEERYKIGVRTNAVSCAVRSTTFMYLKQGNIPVVLVAVNTLERRLYYCDLAEVKVVSMDAQSPIVHIPSGNSCGRDDSYFASWLWEVAAKYYEAAR